MRSHTRRRSQRQANLNRGDMLVNDVPLVDRARGSSYRESSSPHSRPSTPQARYSPILDLPFRDVPVLHFEEPSLVEDSSGSSPHNSQSNSPRSHNDELSILKIDHPLINGGRLISLSFDTSTHRLLCQDDHVMNKATISFLILPRLLEPTNPMTGHHTETESSLKRLSFCTAEHKCQHQISTLYSTFGHRHS
jgi:hypothetical protein